MTEPYGFDDDTADANDDGQDERYVRLTREQIRAMERDAKSARKAQEELTTARRELALARAGLGDLSPAKQKALLANIDGDITAEAARLAAEELGFVQPPAAAPESEDAAALDRMANASTGATDTSSESQVAELERAAREGGQAGLLAMIQKHGNLVTPAG